MAGGVPEVAVFLTAFHGCVKPLAESRCSRRENAGALIRTISPTPRFVQQNARYVIELLQQAGAIRQDAEHGCHVTMHALRALVPTLLQAPACRWEQHGFYTTAAERATPPGEIFAAHTVAYMEGQ